MTCPVTHTVFLPDEAATTALGASLAPYLSAPLVIYLEGGLGAGKTTFTRGLLRTLGYTGTVKSPTYTLVESYPLPSFILNHFDLYRFTSPEEWEDAGLDELFNEKSICLIEWPQQGGDFVPQAEITLSFEHQDEGRLCTLTAHTPQSQKSLEIWTKN
ncbi:MAG: tRNA (adenosine(37)-N6)-threonylcarbamoyltransferase complex ATPase subunit type 1 TsaE [Neisseria sp.]|uniref:tRNA (adenosine(37)-N6)-threonylcarbamoyltransferase complex ATPase subunit type 1 TsaE n=1 Tax=Neisseria sp. TaxID=192066 RepID=UPI0026DB6CD8|nr:tRNA (adenosine(37)-N6)-threonylcarbamoyltransferase complex ATPase subunit type 1 TsaE [Neisseria sp.]MDO4641371.1 tRNA (adenosine(37)-N6)-threonylcarbamoyltransferase complex ATPase subunit type 1 TsaE [Neisseria sp.]